MSTPPAGALCAVVPDSMQFRLELASEGTVAAVPAAAEAVKSVRQVVRMLESHGDPLALVDVAGNMRDDATAGVIGARFHRAVAELIVDLATAEDPVSRTVALSGGAFQNVMLLRLAQNGLATNGFEVLTHRLVPPNDGGVALGQLLVGNAG